MCEAKNMDLEHVATLPWQNSMCQDFDIVYISYLFLSNELPQHLEA